ncbi:MAG: ATP-dependent helicase, partial [Bacteroidetes bacterium]|nr:ATP-dependent helicase [Bacteroidota bacterium]
GDDDQSIYEFQGARIRNIIDFYQRYRQTIKIIVLPQNYRSSQAILDKAGATILHNKQRLIYQLQELKLDKDIVAAAGRFKDGNDTIVPTVKAYANVLQEEADIVMQIEQLQQTGTALNHVAILYAQHKQAENIMALMERKGLPYSVKKSVNILDLPLIQQIISVVSYLEMERKAPYSAEGMLFEIMHAPYYEIDPTDIALLSLYIQQHKQKDRGLSYWRLLLTNDLLLESLNLSSAKALRRLGANINRWQREQTELSLPMLIEKIVYEGGIVNYLTQTKDYTWNIQVLHTFFEFVKDAYSRNPRIKPADLLRMLERMSDEHIAIPIQKVIQNDNGVHFYTAHGAKGNEFEYVFLIGCTKNYWEGKKGSSSDYKLPDTITSTDDDAEKTYKVEVARRLFYVALTRAKKHLQVSYALNDNVGKSLETSVFIDEISVPEERVLPTLAEEDVLKHLEWAIEPVPDVRIKLANHQWLDHTLQQFTMSYTTLSKYLKCPLSFYYENLLRVPFLKNDALAFGSAVHYALERFFRTMKEKHGEFPDKDHLIGAFNSALYGESECFTPIQFERRMEQGNTILSEYYDHYIHQFATNVEIELKIPRYILDGVPVTGKIDKIELDGDNCTVIDYKTGDPDKSASAYTASPNDKEPLGGDYWRQMVFYKLIMENYQEKNWKVKMGIFDFIEKSKKANDYRRVVIPIYDQDEQIVRQQLKNAYTGIMNHEFDKGCGKDDCHWCNFARRYELIRPTENEFVEIDDI